MEYGRIWAEIDLDALEHNLQLVRLATPGKRVMLAIKADAYGHGAAEVGEALKHKVDMFGVAGAEEGINLRQNGVTETPILVLSPLPYPQVPLLFTHNLQPTVTEPAFAELLGCEARARGRTLHVHIEVDTGMGRTGVDIEQVRELVAVIRGFDSLAIDGIFTHFPAADSNFAFTAAQIRDYETLTRELRQESATPLLRHSANTAGFLNFPASHFDMVRPGLIVYGILPDAYLGRAETPLPVKPVMSLRSRVVNLRTMPPGRSISYERRFITKRLSRIAVITAGYGDGYPYALTNHGEVLVNGHRASIAGNVCMDLTMLDVTDIPGVKIGDIVTVMGAAGDDVITANEVAGWAGTIPYEIICRVSPRVPRVYRRGGRVVAVRNLLTGRNHGRESENGTDGNDR